MNVIDKTDHFQDDGKKCLFNILTDLSGIGIGEIGQIGFEKRKN